MEISVDVNINSPKSAVWDAITNIKNSPNMISGIIALEVLNQPETGLVGLKWKETRKMFGKEAVETMWITESVDEQHYHTRAENHGAIYVTKLAVEEANDMTKLTMTFSGHSDSLFVRTISALMSLFMKKTMTKLLQADLGDIKKFVESQ